MGNFRPMAEKESRWVLWKMSDKKKLPKSLREVKFKKWLKRIAYPWFYTFISVSMFNHGTPLVSEVCVNARDSEQLEASPKQKSNTRVQSFRFGIVSLWNDKQERIGDTVIYLPFCILASGFLVTMHQHSELWEALCGDVAYCPENFTLQNSHGTDVTSFKTR